jgi:hypothetical protein
MKAAMVAEYFRWYTIHYDASAVRERVRTSATCRAAGLDADRPLFGVVPSEWYSTVVLNELIDVALDPMIEAERAEFIERSTAAVSAQLMRGLYSVLFALVATPERYSRHIQRAWNQLHDSGEREVSLGSDHAVSVIRRWPAHHPALCSMVHATTRALFSRMLDRPVRIERARCVSEGHPDCASILRW